MNGWVIYQGLAVAWYNYAVVVVLLPMGGLVFYKTVLEYKTIRMGNNQVRVDYLLGRRTRVYRLDQIVTWLENKVKTGKNSEYRELQVHFDDGRKISLGHKEYGEYGRMVEYLKQKAARKKGNAS